MCCFNRARAGAGANALRSCVSGHACFSFYVAQFGFLPPFRPSCLVHLLAPSVSAHALSILSTNTGPAAPHPALCHPAPAHACSVPPAWPGAMLGHPSGTSCHHLPCPALLGRVHTAILTPLSATCCARVAALPHRPQRHTFNSLDPPAPPLFLPCPWPLCLQADFVCQDDGCHDRQCLGNRVEDVFDLRTRTHRYRCVLVHHKNARRQVWGWAGDMGGC